MKEKSIPSWLIGIVIFLMIAIIAIAVILSDDEEDKKLKIKETEEWKRLKERKAKEWRKKQELSDQKMHLKSVQINREKEIEFSKRVNRLYALSCWVFSLIPIIITAILYFTLERNSFDNIMNLISIISIACIGLPLLITYYMNKKKISLKGYISNWVYEGKVEGYYESLAKESQKKADDISKKYDSNKNNETKEEP